MIIADDAFELALCPDSGGRNAQINRNALERFAVFPAGRRIRNQPVLSGGIMDIECARFARGTGLGPVQPQAELEAMIMREVGDTGDAVRKFAQVRLPVANLAEPARVQMKHLQSEL